MKALVIGSGGREHCLAWKIAQSPIVDKVYVAPGNAGSAQEPGVFNVNIAAMDFDALIEFATKESIDLIQNRSLLLHSHMLEMLDQIKKITNLIKFGLKV